MLPFDYTGDLTGNHNTIMTVFLSVPNFRGRCDDRG